MSNVLTSVVSRRDCRLIILFAMEGWPGGVAREAGTEVALENIVGVGLAMMPWAWPGDALLFTLSIV